MSNDFNLSLLNSGIATRAIVGANNARQEAGEQRMRAFAAEAALANVTTDRDLQRKVRMLGDRASFLKASNEHLTQQLAERDALITEWMQSSEAFRRLARQYGKKLGVTDEQRQIDCDAHVMNTADEDPKYAKTNLTKETKAILKII